MRIITQFMGIVLCLLLLPLHALAATVIVDPGHGGADPGAIGVNGLKEKDVNLAIAFKLKEKLIERGYQVIMTRETDRFLSLAQRVEFARSIDHDLFVSVHANAHPDSRISGTLVLYYDNRYPQSAYPASVEMAMLSDENETLAALVQQAMLAQMGTQDRGLVPSSAYVIRNGRVPSILVETAFLSNKGDAALLATDSFQRLAAEGIADGIGKYEPPVFIDIGRHWAGAPIVRLAKLGVVRGNNRKYEPDRTMTRAEFMTLLDNVFPFDERLAGNAQAEETAAQADSARDEAAQAATGGQAAQVQEATAQEVAAQAPAASRTQSEAETERQEASGQVTAEEQAPAEAASTVQAAMPALSASAFADLSQTHWAYATIDKAIRLGLLQGYEDATIRPDASISRAQMAVIFDRIALLGAGMADTGERTGLPFQDIPLQTWYYASIAKMYTLGLIQGVTASTFAPQQAMTRAEAAIVLDRFLGTPSGQVVMHELEARQAQL